MPCVPRLGVKSRCWRPSLRALCRRSGAFFPARRPRKTPEARAEACRVCRQVKAQATPTRLPAMAAVVIVGAQWGDEGKIVDLLTELADMVVRFGGGPNAGHTLVVGEDPKSADKVVVRLIPSGILRPGTRCVLGQGMVIDPESLLGEIDELVRRGHLPGGFDANRLA